MSNVIVLPARRRYWADQINEAWEAAVEAIFETGRRLITAKADPTLPHGEFEAMVKEDLHFDPSTARRLIIIARDTRLDNIVRTTHVLPPSWYILYELTKLSDSQFQIMLDHHMLRPDVTQTEILPIVRALRRNEKQVEHRANIVGGLINDLQTFINSGRRVGTVYADPPWLYDNQVTRSATSNVYDGMTVNELCRLPVREIAAADAHLHVWTTNAFLFECFKLFAAWGFDFKSSFVWVKPRMGIGNYWRNAHEFLLTAVRGNATRFFDHSLDSWIKCKPGKHSSKPEQVRGYIERASPGPWLEMFARHPAPDWLSWGHEIRDSLLSQGMDTVE